MHVVLVHPQIPPNTGNVARLCVATGLKLHLIHPLGFHVDEASVRRAGLDYWGHLQLEEHSCWEDFEKKNFGACLHFYSKKVERPYTQARYQKDDFLIFGSETKGLSEEILAKYSSQVWTIPMWGPTRSLNLSTSVGIVAYEALRQVTGGFCLDQWGS
jgi:tRNA (cytidine/uridine-2'-O-)-methyltransferase